MFSKSSKRQPSKKFSSPQRIIDTDFHRFLSGAILDLIRDRKHGTALILYRNRKFQIAHQIKYQGRIWRPSSHPIIANMGLPRSIGHYEDASLVDLISADCILDEIYRFLLTFMD